VEGGGASNPSLWAQERSSGRQPLKSGKKQSENSKEIKCHHTISRGEPTEVAKGVVQTKKRAHQASIDEKQGGKGYGKKPIGYVG